MSALEIEKNLNQAGGMQQAYINQKASALVKIDQIDSILSQKDKIEKVLKSYEKLAFSMGGGIMCDLLSSMLTDVFGGEQEIVLESQVKYSMPELYISTLVDGMQLDALSSRGGSVVNVIATALRIITLLQSNSRPILVLDEADCWIASKIVSRYFSVLERVCSEIGVQLVFLSHHNNLSLSDETKEIHLNKESRNAKVKVTTTGDFSVGIDELDTLAAERKSQSLTSIYLENIMAHESTLVPLGQGLNIIRGANDSGKSCLVRALNSIRSNSFCSPQLIRHGETQAVISVAFLDGITIKWIIDASRARKGAKGLIGVVNTYQAVETETGDIVSEETVKLNDPVPSFVEQQFSMNANKSGFDVNVSEQQDPLGLLNPAITPKDRAEMIDLGRAFEVAISLFKKNKKMMSDMKANKRRESEMISDIDGKLKQLSPGAEISDLLDMIKGIGNLQVKLDKRASFLSAKIALLSHEVGDVAAFDNTENILSDAISIESMGPDLSEKANLINSFMNSFVDTDSISQMEADIVKGGALINLSHGLSQNIESSIGLIRNISEYSKSDASLETASMLEYQVKLSSGVIGTGKKLKIAHDAVNLLIQLTSEIKAHEALMERNQIKEKELERKIESKTCHACGQLLREGDTHVTH